MVDVEYDISGFVCIMDCIYKRNLEYIIKLK